jgi:hypothetical protein
MIEWHSPFSDSVARLGHDPDTNIMYVTWKNGGRTSLYQDVSPEKFDTARKSTSVYTFVRNEIMPWHKHSYLTE